MINVRKHVTPTDVAAERQACSLLFVVRVGFEAAQVRTQGPSL